MSQPGAAAAAGPAHPWARCQARRTLSAAATGSAAAAASAPAQPLDGTPVSPITLSSSDSSSDHLLALHQYSSESEAEEKPRSVRAAQLRELVVVSDSESDCSDGGGGVAAMQLSPSASPGIPLSQPSAAAASVLSPSCTPPRARSRPSKRRRSRFVDDEAAASDGDNAESASESDEVSLGMAAFLAEPSEEELARAGLVFESSGDEADPVAILRERRPFARFRRQPEAPVAAPVAAAASDSDSQPGEACSLAGASAAFLELVRGCAGWLPDPSLLHDSERSAALYQQVLDGYAYAKLAVRQAKGAAELPERGLSELSAVVQYLVHIVSERLQLRWQGPLMERSGAAVEGVLLRPHPSHPNLVCAPVCVREQPLSLHTALHSLVLHHPRNARWLDLVIGKRFFRDLVYLVHQQLKPYSECDALVAYRDQVYNLHTGVLTAVGAFDPSAQGFCGKLFDCAFPTRFDLPLTIGILAQQGYSLYAVLVLFAFLGRLLFPLDPARENWIQLLFLLGKTQTGKTTLYRLVTEGCMDPRGVRQVPADPKYPLQSLYATAGARLWSNADTLMDNFLRAVTEESLLKLVDGSNQAYPAKNKTAIERRNTLPGVIVSNRDAGYAAGDAGGSLSSRIAYFPFFSMVADSAKDTTLVQRLLDEEAPVFVVVSTCLYRALIRAVGSESILEWYPAIVRKIKAEVQEDLHGFVRWLNTNTIKSASGEFILLSDAQSAYNVHLEKTGEASEKRAWRSAMNSKQLEARLKQAGYVLRVAGAEESRQIQQQWEQSAAAGGGGAAGAAASSSAARRGAAAGSGGEAQRPVSRTARRFPVQARADSTLVKLEGRRWLRPSDEHAAMAPRPASIMQGGLRPTDASLLSRQVAAMMAALRGRYTTHNDARDVYVGGALSKLVYWLSQERLRDVHHPAAAADSDEAEYRHQPPLRITILTEPKPRKRPKRHSHPNPHVSPSPVVLSLVSTSSDGEDVPAGSAAAAAVGAGAGADSESSLDWDGVAAWEAEVSAQRASAAAAAAGLSRPPLAMLPGASQPSQHSPSDASYGVCVFDECRIVRVARQASAGVGANHGRFFLNCRHARSGQGNEHNKSFVWRDVWLVQQGLPLPPADQAWLDQHPNGLAAQQVHTAKALRASKAAVAAASSPSSAAPASSPASVASGAATLQLPASALPIGQR